MEGIRAAPVIPRNCVVPVQIKRPRMPRSRLALSAATALVPVQWTMPASAAGPLLPSGGNFVAGAGAIAQSGASLSVNQTSNRAIIDWRSFSIGAGGKVTINNGNGATLNRVTGAEQSRLAGSLSASGSVYLINPNGVLVLPGGRIVTGGDFVASSLSPGMAAFMRGGSLTLSGTSQASVINNGDIVSQRGDVMLIARDVASTGSINAPNGTAALVAAQQVVLREARPGDTVSVELPGGNVTASGAIQAASVRLNAAGGNIYALAGNNGGLIEATGTSKRDGRVWLSAGGDTTVQGTIAATGTVSVQSGGTVAVSGKIAAASKAGVGGLIDVNGGKVILSGAHLDASGAAKGGTIALGGAKNGTTAAGTVVVDAASTLLANGGSVGNGGSVSIWSSGLTDFRGLLEARGGSLGQGGAAEVSSAGELLFAGAVKLDGGAGLGRLLLDPSSVNIINAGGAAANPIGGSIVDPQAIVDALATANVTLTAGGGGITVSSPVSWASSGTLTLNSAGNLVVGGALTQAAPIGTTGGITLIAGGAIYIRQNITGTGGLVDVLVNANANDTGGGIVVGDAGVVSISTTGNITLGGGAALDGSGYAVGNNSSFNYIGIALEAATTLAAGGTVTLRGQGGNIPGGANYGISVFSGTLIGAGVTLQGTSGISTSGAFGVILGNYGFLSAGATKAVTVEASTGDLVVAGVATYTGNEGVGNAKAGITLNTDVTLTADKGSVSLTGINTSDGAGAAAGISLAAGDTITAANTIAIWGSATAGTQVAVSLAGTLTTTGTLGQIDLTANRIALGGTIVTSGAVRITPVDFGWNVDLGSIAKTAASTLELSATELGLINAGTVTVGSTPYGALTVTAPLSLTSVRNLNLVAGESLFIAAPLALTIPVGTFGGISLIAGADIFVNSNITGSGGSVDLLANANSSGGGGIMVGAFTGALAGLSAGDATLSGTPVNIHITGNLTFGGGPAGNGSGYAVGLNTYYQMGVVLFHQTAINAGGSATIRGQGGSQSYAYGVELIDATIAAASIYISGRSQPTVATSVGVAIGDQATDSVLFASSGNITMFGGPVGGDGDSLQQYGVLVGQLGVVSAPAGSVFIDGFGLRGIEARLGSVILARDTIALTGSGATSGSLGLNLLGTVIGQGGAAAIDLIGDRIAIGGPITAITGRVSIESLTPGTNIDLGSTAKTADNTLELSAAEIQTVVADTLAIGSPTSGDMTLTAPIALYNVRNAGFEAGGTLSQFAPLSLTIPVGQAGTLALVAGGDIFIRGNIAGNGGTVSLLVNSNRTDKGGGITIGGFTGSTTAQLDGGGEGYTNVPTIIDVTGDATLGGGAAGDGSGFAVGLNSIWKMGVVMTPAVTLTAGGAVTLRGEASASALYGYAIEMSQNDTIVGSSVSLIGRAPPTAIYPYGVVIGDNGFTSSVIATSGDVTIYGIPTTLELVNAQGAGVIVGAHGTVSAPLGSIVLSGTGAIGVYTVPGSTLSAGENVHVTGAATASGQLALNVLGSIVASGASSEIGLTGDRIAISGTIVTPGSVSVAPLTPGWDIDLGSTAKTAANTLELSAAELGLINAGTLAIGSMNSGGLTQTQPLAFTTVNTLQLTGGTTLTLAAPLSLTTPAGISGAISLVSGADMYIATNVVGAGGHVDLMANSNASGIGGGIQFGAYEGTIGQLVDGSIYELNANYLIAATGNITFGGGIARDGSGYAVGLSTYFHEGINFFNYPTIVAGGSVTMRGTGGDASYYPYGINMWFGTIQASEILLSGVSGSIAYGRALGVLLGANNRLTATNGNIVIVGNESSVTASNPSNGAGIYIMSGNTLSAPGGAVELIGIGGAPVAFGIAKGVQIDSNTTITAANLIYLEGIVSDANQLALDVNGTLGGAGSSAYIALTGDRIAIGGTIVTSGLVSIAPLTSLFDVNLGSTGKTAASTLELSATELAIISAGALEILSDRTIFLTADLVPNVDVLNLSGIGGITQTAGSLAVANLFLGGKSARLNTATNAIGTIATTLSGALDVNAGGPITVGMVQGHEGIAAGGSVALRATGAVTLDAPIVSNGTGDAVVVAGSTFVNNAGISGIDTVSGRWLVFTPNAGSITAGGLAATNWVGTSIDNYDSGTPVGAGDRFVIATPGTLTITPDSLVTTYGTAGPAPTYSFSGLLPGDSLAAAISGTPSNAGLAIDGGVHVVNATPGSLLSLENYILQFGTGTLTVNKAPLTIQALDVAKSFGTVLTFNGTGFSTNGLIGGDQVSLTTLTSAGAGATAGPGGSPYRIDVSGAQGVGVANYAIRYLPGSLTVTAPLSTAGTGATAIGVLSLPVTLPPPPQPPAVRVPIQLASLNLGLSTGINLSPGSGSPTISDAPAPGLFPAPASPNRSPARPAAQSQPAITDETPPAAPARGPVAESRPSALGPETTTPGGPSLTPGDGPGLASAPASPPMQMASLTTGETPVGNSARQEPTAPSRSPADALAQGDVSSLQSAPLTVPANVSPSDAQATFADRTSQLVSAGMSPQAAAEGAGRAVEQMGAAATRSGASTPAQSLGDALAAGGSGAASGSPALTAALASGRSPAQALATAALAGRTEAAMRAAASMPSSPANTAAAALANSGIPANVPNPGAFAKALATGMNPAAALLASQTAARTRVQMETRATLSDTPDRHASSALAGGDPSAMPGIAGNRSAETALAGALGRGGSMEDALAMAARAAASLDDQERRGAVKLSDRDACRAGMAVGGASGGCGGEAAEKQHQLQTAAVEADADASALAEGRMPQIDAGSEVVGRMLRLGTDPRAIQKLLAAWSAASERQSDAARTSTGGAANDDKAALIERLAQGHPTQQDIDLIVRMTRTVSLDGISRWLRPAEQNEDTGPQANRRPASDGGG